jgi:hypothetical protein
MTSPLLPFTAFPQKTTALWMLRGCSAFPAGGVMIALEGQRMGWLSGGFFALGIPTFLLQFHPISSFLTVSAVGIEFAALFRRSFFPSQGFSEFRVGGLPVGKLVGFNYASRNAPARLARLFSRSLPI